MLQVNDYWVLVTGYWYGYEVMLLLWLPLA
jgi:hypothetical protein